MCESVDAWRLDVAYWMDEEWKWVSGYAKEFARV